MVKQDNSIRGKVKLIADTSSQVGSCSLDQPEISVTRHLNQPQASNDGMMLVELMFLGPLSGLHGCLESNIAVHQYDRFAQGSVVPTPAPPLDPLTAALDGAETITPTLLVATIT